MLRLASDSLIWGHARELHRDSFALYERCERLGPLVRLRIVHSPLYVVTGPSLIEEVLVGQANHFDKPLLLKNLDWLFGRGLLTSDGPGYRHRRKLVQPAFAREYHAAYVSELRGRVEAMRRQLLSGTYDVYQLVVGVCVEQLTSFFFGTESPELSARIRDVAALCHQVAENATQAPWTFVFPSLHRGSHAHRVRALELCLEQLSEPGMRRSHRPRTLYDRLREGRDVDGCPMRREAVREEAVTLALAGHETTAVAVSWALYLLARDPERLARLQTELDSVCRDDVPSLEQLGRLSYLDAVIKETYRLYPPTHRIGRTTNREVVLGGQRLARGTELHLPQWAVHRSARWYRRPFEFLPERWLTGEQKQLPRYAYFPFSGGQRSCPGRDVASLEDALLVAGLVQHCDLQLPAGACARPNSGLTLQPCPSKVKLTRRLKAVPSSSRSLASGSAPSAGHVPA